MNTSHYPNLELCKKLTSIGFPETYINFIKPEHSALTPVEIYWEEDGMVMTNANFPKVWENYVCPSVMEMLDVMPNKLPILVSGFTPSLQITKDSNGKYYVDYVVGYEPTEYFTFEGTLPNALAEMVVFLVESNLLSFSK